MHCLINLLKGICPTACLGIPQRLLIRSFSEWNKVIALGALAVHSLKADRVLSPELLLPIIHQGPLPVLAIFGFTVRAV